MRKMYSQKQIERIALNIVENDDGFSDWLGDLINEHIADWVVENEIPIASIYDEEELKERYCIQLQMYQLALERALGLKVREVYIYSLAMGKEIRL